MFTTDAALQRVKGIKKSFDNGIKKGLETYMNTGVINFYKTSEISEIFTSTESMADVNELGETETPRSLTLEDGYSVTISEKRYGGALVLPENVYRREGADSTWKVDEFLRRQRDKLLKKTLNRMLVNAHTFLNEAFLSTSVYLAPDGVELCGTHTWASGGTFVNKITAALSQDAVDDMMELAGAFVDPSGTPMPLNLDTVVVKKGSDNEREAVRLFASGINPTAYSDVNVYEGMVKVIATPYISSANKNYWFMVDSSYESPLAVGIGEYPTMREPIRLENEAIRSNCTGFWKQGINNMPFNFIGSDGTT
jgi:hypothetical protein